MDKHKAPFLSASLKQSSNLDEVVYDPFMRVLSLTFKNGSTYDYLNVDKEVFYEIKQAESAGKYFHNNIRGKYDFFKQAKKKEITHTDNEEEEEGEPSNGNEEE